ncbi:RHS repeat-associated core domain-containing protein, partial [Geobacter grbiciae]|uniref:RHS repeat-associated core domain-containing protein n=1 Tax=Geobacter grbiciae TaxID=155042 RepID=UPI001C0184EB
FKYVGTYGVMSEPNGLYYMKARYYDASIGRFISEDPAGFSAGDVNLMAYVGGNPIMGVDPSGLINPGLISEGFSNLAKGGVLVVGGALLSGTGGAGAVVGVGSAIYGAEMAGRGVVQMATGLIQSNPVSIPNPSLTYNASYALTKSHQAADFTYNTSSLLLGAAAGGATPSMSSLEAVYNALDTTMTLRDTFSGMKGCGR